MNAICTKCKMRTMYRSFDDMWVCRNCGHMIPINDVMESKYIETGKGILRTN